MKVSDMDLITIGLDAVRSLGYDSSKEGYTESALSEICRNTLTNWMSLPTGEGEMLTLSCITANV